ncbi:TIGR03751 family conjugal transfer lipoprotein [Klebsiella pneumoniae]|uniref:TIGR03751 family conjugal transfer lipoprotein n=1 Tax=Klebsiella pneumoniae TaxID=573 RepID=UPI000DE767CD|nr:TIGR03751 family conjugal transfer lipoprotein [Klebsiella pneumoniae]EKX4007251.1 TIGR03751 family conjugal transfer lipoprotein [Enterobacter cloacae]MEA4464955.1 TIGR03751 family conjugal transfer lipoprotein [Klebsiella pneumoniae]MEA4505678.1 TIGR03751 family conjugal transfer lipoprotein [Klebsiella pneumoniae]SSJ94767.1 lipoprotein [Klebsiella pneumoniae]HBS7933994.1 TIGR03751 family conjugal transfer lipoprotein [Klebsiella pneumoniae]
MIRAILTLLFLLAGCSTSQEELMPVAPDASMLTLWQQQSVGNAALLDARTQLRRSPDGPVAQSEVETIRSQFPRLPNPDMVLYVFPHLNGNTPVPGYGTVFPFYTRPQYALPGERLTPP